MLAIGGIEAHGWLSRRTLAALAIAGALLTAFAHIETRAARPLLLGLGVGMVPVCVSITTMHGIPPQHAGTASRFLLTGHEIGAALGVAVLSAIATTTGALTDQAGAVEAASRGYTAAAGLAAAFAVIAFWRMPATRVDTAGAGCTCTEPGCSARQWKDSHRTGSSARCSCLPASPLGTYPRCRIPLPSG